MDTPITATITDYSPTVAVHDIKEQISTLEAQINTLRDTLTRERAKVRDLYTNINDEIQSNELDEDSTLTYRELSDHLSAVFGNELTFFTEYEADIEFTVRVVAKFKAADSSAAREIADSIELNADSDTVSWSGDGDDEITEVWVDSTRVRSVNEQ